MKQIHLNQLVIKGISKDYSVTFKNGLNIISGEISTGKSSVLEFIDYCFGAQNHPLYQEIQHKARTVLLEFYIDKDEYVIERQLFSSKGTANIHFCSISKLETKHDVLEVNASQKKDSTSISSFLLEKAGIGQIPLKQAPKQDASAINIMSWRDIMWLCYLESSRVAGENLLFESIQMKNIKLKQVFDVLFGIHSERLAVICSQIDDAEEDIKKRNESLITLTNFIKMEDIPDLKALDENEFVLNNNISSAKSRLSEITKTLQGSSDIAKEIVTDIELMRRELQQVRTEIRNATTTIGRLIPLRGQYADDISKLNFLAEARKLIDPLRLSRCPLCLTHIKENDNKDLCPVCGGVTPQEDILIDVSKEIRTVEQKLKELNEYSEELEKKIRESKIIEETRLSELNRLSEKLDEITKEFVSPYITERDHLVEKLARSERGLQEIQKFKKIRNDIYKMDIEKNQLQEHLYKLKEQLEVERKKVPERKEVFDSISKSFVNNLESCSFPKISDAYIDNKLVPIIRGIPYRELKSEGAINLASLCWLLSIFKELILKESHPGFLLLDGLQRGIGISAHSEPEEFRDDAIVSGLYSILINITTQNNVQIIAVDGHPPSNMDQHVIVRYSGVSSQPPYGLIDDEVG